MCFLDNCKYGILWPLHIFITPTDWSKGKGYTTIEDEGLRLNVSLNIQSSKTNVRRRVFGCNKLLKNTHVG